MAQNIGAASAFIGAPGSFSFGRNAPLKKPQAFAHCGLPGLKMDCR
jgi:hypothetical protein